MECAPLDPVQLDKLRRDGLMAVTATGQEAVHVSAQMPSVTSASRAELKAEMTAWASRLGDMLSQFGGEVVPDSMSVSGQTVQALVPVDRLEGAQKALSDAQVRIDMILDRQSLPPG